MKRSSSRRTLVATITSIVFAALLIGCGNSVDPALVNSAGQHGNALEAVIVQLQSNALDNASSRDLKDINRAINAGDLRKATPGDVRRGQSEIRSRIDKLDSMRSKMLAATGKLRRTPIPNFKAYLEQNQNTESFVSAYTKATKAVTRSSGVVLVATRVAMTSLERYLDFLEEWEELLASDDTDNLVASAKASDKALATLNRRKSTLKIAGDPTIELKILVNQMASAVSNDAQLKSLIDALKKDYPKSFLSVHIIEK